MSSEVTPYGSDASKKEQVKMMFDNIAHRYDLLNRVLSLGIDQIWRQKMVQKIGTTEPVSLLDIATGTGDVALLLSKIRTARRIVGLDISPEMLKLAEQKLAKTRSQGEKKEIEFQLGDSENLPFADNSFDAVSVAFGVRNFEHTVKGLAECHRVLKSGGRLAILEFSHPTRSPFKQIFNAYFKYVLPLVGRFTSKDRRAYRYLFESVQAFPQYNDFVDLLVEAGFESGTFRPFTFGICTLYWSDKSS